MIVVSVLSRSLLTNVADAAAIAVVRMRLKLPLFIKPWLFVCYGCFVKCELYVYVLEEWMNG